MKLSSCQVCSSKHFTNGQMQLSIIDSNNVMEQRINVGEALIRSFQLNWIKSVHKLKGSLLPFLSMKQTCEPLAIIESSNLHKTEIVRSMRTFASKCAWLRRQVWTCLTDRVQRGEPPCAQNSESHHRKCEAMLILQMHINTLCIRETVANSV